MGHTGTSDGLNESFLDDAFLDVQGQLTGALLRSTPADTVGQTADVLDFHCLRPLALLRDRSRTMVCALSDRTHVFHFCGIKHNFYPFLKQIIFFPNWKKTLQLNQNLSFSEKKSR